LPPPGGLDHLESLAMIHPTPMAHVFGFVHVTDLADAHVGAVRYLWRGVQSGRKSWTGQGTSIREVLETVKAVTGLNVPIVIRTRRGETRQRWVLDASWRSAA